MLLQGTRTKHRQGIPPKLWSEFQRGLHSCLESAIPDPVLFFFVLFNVFYAVNHLAVTGFNLIFHRIFKEFTGNRDPDTVVTHQLNPPIEARYIRFLPVTWNNWISMRVELYGYPQGTERLFASKLLWNVNVVQGVGLFWEERHGIDGTKISGSFFPI